MLANIKRCDFSYQSLVYFGYMIGGGELKINPEKIEDILKCLVPINVTKVRIFVGAT
jgi:hypothetical protein